MQEPQNKSRYLLSILIFLLCVFGALLAAALVCCNSLLRRVSHVELPPPTVAQPEPTIEPEPAPTAEDIIKLPKERLNILIVGQASREGETGRLADTMVLCTLNPDDKTITLTSLLRDAFVRMPDYRGHRGGRIKLTSIYNLGSLFGDGIAGSMELLNLTLAENFGIEVDHNIEIDFDGFVEIIDLLGGIDIELTEAEAEYLNRDEVWSNHRVEAGPAHLDGMETLCYARMRKARGDGESDIIRTARQRKVITLLAEKLRGQSFPAMQRIVSKSLPLISTDMTTAEITRLLLALAPIRRELTLNSGGTCPAHYSGDLVDIYGDGTMHSVLRFDEAETKAEMRSLTERE